MVNGLPATYQDFTELGWDEIEPYTEALLQSELSIDTIDIWLKNWTLIASLITECFYRLQLRTMTHTNDVENTKRFHDYSENIMPNAKIFEQSMIDLLLKSGIEPENFSIPLRKMRSDTQIFLEKNLPLQTEIDKLLIQQQEITGSRMIDWDGQEITIKEAADKIIDPERNIREKAWRLICSRVAQDRDAIDDIWSQLLDQRLEIATNAGFDDFRSYQWRKLGRFDYSFNDCLAFHQSIEDVVVPAVSKISKKRKKRLGVDKLRVWDDHWYLKPDSSGLPPIKPYKDIDDLNKKMETIFSSVDSDLGGYYQIMVEEGLLDLEARKHKSLVGYMEELPASKRPFIITNVSNTTGDISTLLHEGGHAFHVFESAHWPFHYQSSINQMPIEFAEVGSMAMELLAYPYLTLDQGGFFTRAEAARAKIEHLEIILGFFPYMAVVDAFQHWVYENPNDAHDPESCDEVWSTLHKRYLPHLDWSSIEDTLGPGWQFQGHIFFDPFYYVEYGIAQLGAIQIWENAQQDQEKAVQLYRNALALGNTASLLDLFKAAGVKFAFDTETLKRAVDTIERAITELEQID